MISAYSGKTVARPLSFNEIEAFRAVMLTGTTVAAAKMLHTTQPSISRLITQAQQASELTLFQIYKGRLRPTREALQLFDAVQRYYRGADKIQETVIALRESGSGVLRIASTPTIALGVLPSALREFLARYPQVRVTVETLATDRIREGMMHGLYDIAFTNNALDDDSCESEVVGVGLAVCIMSVGHPLTKLEKVTPADLRYYPLLYLQGDDSLDSEWRSRLSAHHVTPPNYIETTYYATMCMFAAEGLGVGLVNPYLVPVFSSKIGVRSFAPEINVQTFISYSRLHPQSAMSPHFAEKFVEKLKMVEEQVSAVIAKPSQGL